MSNRALLLAIAACFAVAACDKKDEPPKPKTTAAVVPLPPEAPKAAAASAAQDAKPVQLADAPKSKAAAPGKRAGTKGCGNGKCVVNIKNIKLENGKCSATYNAEKLEVAGSPETITWHATGGWMFEQNGIDLPIGGGQFSNPQGHGTGKYTVVDANTDITPYKYTVKLKKGKDKCELDPSIANGAETIDPNYPPP